MNLETQEEKDAFYAGRKAWDDQEDHESDDDGVDLNPHEKGTAVYDAFQLGWQQKQDDHEAEGGFNEDDEDEDED